MIGPTKLTEKQKEVLKELVGNKCELCSNTEGLDIHRIIRGNVDGKYIPRNCQIICNNCHKLLHSHEQMGAKG